MRSEWDGARLERDGGLRLTPRTALFMERCLSVMRDAVKAVDGEELWELDSQEERYHRVDFSSDLVLAARLLDLLRAVRGEPAEIALYPREANLCRLADHNFMIVLLVYDKARARDGSIVDFTEARSYQRQYSEIVKEWPTPIENGRYAVQRVR